MSVRRRLTLSAALALGVAAPVAAPLLAQQGTTLGYQWLQAVKDEDGVKLNKMTAERSKLNAAVLDYQAEGEGAIHIAVRRGNERYVRLMLALGANANLVSTREGETPLTLAIAANQPELLPYLLSGGAKIDGPNRAGETPLIKAVRFNRPDMVKLLLDRGANPDKADYAGQSARNYADTNTRVPMLAKLIADAPKRTVRPVAGPRLN